MVLGLKNDRFFTRTAIACCGIFMDIDCANNFLTIFRTSICQAKSWVCECLLNKLIYLKHASFHDETKIILLKFWCPEHRGVIKCADSKIICFIIIRHFLTQQFMLCQLRDPYPVLKIPMWIEIRVAAMMNMSARNRISFYELQLEFHEALAFLQCFPFSILFLTLTKLNLIRIELLFLTWGTCQAAMEVYEIG